MKKKVLLAIDLEAPASWAASYAVQLAARLELSLLLMAVGSGILQPTLYAGAKEYTDPRTAAVTFSLVYAIMNFGIVAENLVSPFIRTDTTFLHLGNFTLNGLGKGMSGVFWFCAGFTAAFLLFPRPILSLFTQDATLIAKAAPLLMPNTATATALRVMFLRRLRPASIPPEPRRARCGGPCGGSLPAQPQSSCGSEDQCVWEFR